jgi:hypothetical protein
MVRCCAVWNRFASCFDAVGRRWISFGSLFDYNLKEPHFDLIEKRLASYMLVSALGLTIAMQTAVGVTREEYDSFNVTQAEWEMEDNTIRSTVFFNPKTPAALTDLVKSRFDSATALSFSFLATSLVIALNSYVMLLSVNKTKLTASYAFVHGPLAG